MTLSQTLLHHITEARKPTQLTLGAGPPYRVVAIHSAHTGDLEPVKCDHCKALLVKKQVDIECKEGGTFTIGSSCAKKVGGERLVAKVKQKEEEEIYKQIRDLYNQKKPRLENLWLDDMPSGIINNSTWRKIQQVQRRRGKSMNAREIVNMVLTYRSIPKSKTAVFVDWLRKL